MTVTTITAGGPGTYTVPAGVRWISVELFGRAGESIEADEGVGLGGRGGRLKVLVRVRPGEILDYCVGRLGSTAATDMCRGGAPVANIGSRTGGRGGGGTYIARRSYSASTATERLRANMIAVAGGGGGGRRPQTPDGVTAPTWKHLGGSSIAFDALVARYVRDGAAVETAAWVKSFVEANVGSVVDNSPNSYDFDYNRSSAGRGGQHFNTVQPVLTNSFSGADSPYGGAGGGGGYQGGEAGRVHSFSGTEWGSAGGAGTSWWDPYVSTVYYDSLVGNGSPGGGRIIIDDSPSFGSVIPLGDVEPTYTYGQAGDAPGGDWGRARVRLRAPIDGFPALDTGFYFVPTEGNRMVTPEGSYVPGVRSDIRVTSFDQYDGYHGPPIGDSPAGGESILPAVREHYPAYRPGKQPGESWLGGDIVYHFYTRAALFKGAVTVAPLQLRFAADGEAKTFISSEFNIGYTTSHPPRVTLEAPAAGAVTPVPDSSPAAATTFTASVYDTASVGAASALYEDVITSYTLDLYEADQTTIVKSIATTPATPIPVPRGGSLVTISASPALAKAEWERVAFWRMSSKDKHGTESVQVAMRPIAMRARPTVQIVAPISGDVIEGSKPSILINVTTPNGSGIFTTRYQVLTSSFTSVYDVTLNGLVASHTPANSVFAGLGSYIIRVTVTDLLGLAATTEIPVTSDYAAPPPVAYSVDDSRVEDDGYVEVRWQEAVAAEGFSRWNVYRREVPSSSWTLLSSIPSAGIRAYRDSTAVAGRIYMYSVTQVLVDRGGEIEGVVGVRYIPKTVPDLMNLASHTSPGYNSGDIPNGTLGFTSRAASNASFDSSVVVNPDAGAPRPLYARNLATNPSFEATSGTVEVRRNLATNPSFEATSSTVEMRRNRALTPMPYREAVASAAWFPEWGTGGSGASAYSASGGPDGVPYFGMTWGVAGTSNTRMRLTGQNTQGIPVTVGEVFPVSLDVASNHPAGVRIAWDWYNDTTFVGSGSGAFVVPSADIASPTRISATTNAAPAGANRLILFVYCYLPAVGTYIRATRLLVGDEGAFFAPGLPSPDSDLTPVWTGTANASASVLTGVAVAGAPITGAMAALSSQQWATHGARSLRIIPRATGGNAYVDLGGGTGGLRFGMVGGRTYTILATYRLAAPQTGTLDSLARRVVVYHRTGGTGSYTALPSPAAMSPNVAGEHQIRYTVSLPEGATEAFPRLFNGASVGGGDVWWDSLVIVEGEYSGPYFDGSTSFDSDLTPAWTGNANASPSILTGQRVTNALYGAVGHQSSQWASSGTRSVMIQSTRTSVGEAIGFVFGTWGKLSGLSAGKTYTIMAKVRMTGPITNSAASRRLALRGAGTTTQSSDQWPNEAGVYDVRFVATLGASATEAIVQLQHQGVASDPPIWLDDLAIIEGDYDGPWFDGANPPAGYESLWEGAANASASVLTGPTEHVPGYGGKYMSHKHINATRPTDVGGIFFSPYSHGFANNPASNTGASGTSNLAADSGYSYTASLYVYNNTGAALGGYLAIEVYNSSGAVISSLTAKSVQRLAATPGWVRFSATTARLDSSAKFIGVTWIDSSGASAPVNGEILYAGLMVERSESPLTNPSGYFNGARPNDASYNYSWLGAPWVTQSLREQISMRDEDRTFLITNSNYWLLDPVNPERSIKLPNVKQYDYTEEYERLATNIIGRGRHVDFGDRLGRTGTLVMSIREPGTRSLKREDIFAFVASKTYFILKTPFGESFPVALGNPTWTQLAGVGSSDMGDLSLPFEEVY